jgi:hypothetical protein
MAPQAEDHVTEIAHCGGDRRLVADLQARLQGLLAPVERRFVAVSQGDFPEGQPAASPALPNTGALMKRSWNGEFVTVTDGLNQPTSLEFIDDIAYVVMLGGEIWKIDLRD